jgi:PAS domain S-box-containing protein
MSIAAIRGLARSVPVVLAVVAYLALAMAASALILLGGPTWSPAGLLVAAVLPIIGFAAGVLVYRGQGTAALEHSQRGELRRSHDLLATAEELAGVASWEFDPSLGSAHWSAATWRMLGVDPSTTEVDDGSFERHVHPADLESFRRVGPDALLTGAPLDGEFRIVRPDGEIRHIRATGRVESDADGRPIRMVGANLDVTEARRATERLRFQADILANVRESVIATDLDGRIAYWSPGASAIFGYTAEEMLGTRQASMDPRPAETLADERAAILAGSDSEAEIEGRRKDGTTVWLHVQTTLMRDAAGDAVGFIGVASDVSQRRESQAMLARLGSAVEQSSESVMIANTRAEIEYVNPAFERVSGYRREEVLGKNPRILQGGDQPASFYQAMWATLLDGRVWTADFVNRRKDGMQFVEEAVVSPIREASGEISGYVAVKRDVTEQRRLEAEGATQVRERALIAETIRAISGRESPEETSEAICRQVVSLAGVASAGLFIFELDERAAPYGFAVAGHASPTLRRVPRRRTAYLVEQANRGPWIERWQDRPWHPYNQLYMELGARAVAYAPVRDGQQVIGFLHITSTADNAEEQLADRLPALVEFADIASTLISAKIAARTEVEAVRQGIRRIIRENSFVPVFQPIVDIMRDEIVGYEALTRFADGVAPDVRFAEAANVGLGDDLELATLRRALEAAHGLPRGPWLNLNTSPHLVVESEQLRQLVATSEADLVLEVTEHAAIADYPAFQRAVELLGPRVRVAVDDAGAGFASLRHILELRPAFVKLDRGLISGIDTDEARRALVAGMRHFANTTGMRLIAEGVESKAELAVLRELDVHLAQGFLLGRPQPIARAATRPLRLVEPARRLAERASA